MHRMQRRALRASAAAVAVMLSACYRVTVITGQPAPTPAPIAPTVPAENVIDRPWQHSFVLGLVPPPELSTRERCPNGAGQVVTEQSFLNGLVRALTAGIYTPMHTRVICAAAPGSR